MSKEARSTKWWQFYSFKQFSIDLNSWILKTVKIHVQVFEYFSQAYFSLSTTYSRLFRPTKFLIPFHFFCWKFFFEVNVFFSFSAFLSAPPEKECGDNSIISFFICWLSFHHEFLYVKVKVFPFIIYMLRLLLVHHTSNTYDLIEHIPLNKI